MNQSQGQQVSVEDAFPIYRQRASELFDENLILRSKIGILERRVAELEKENAELQQRADAPQESAYDGPR